MKTEFRVIRIIDQYSILINGGLEDGLEVGANLAICRDDATVIEDPITGEVLGTLESDPVNIVIKDIFDRFSVCVNKRTSLVASDIIMQNFLQSLQKTTRAPLPVNPADMAGLPAVKPRNIIVGDRVVLIGLPQSNEVASQNLTDDTDSSKGKQE